MRLCGAVAITPDFLPLDDNNQLAKSFFRLEVVHDHISKLRCRKAEPFCFLAQLVWTLAESMGSKLPNLGDPYLSAANVRPSNSLMRDEILQK